MMNRIVQIKLGNGEIAHAEIKDENYFEDASTNKTPKEVSDDYIDIASNVLQSLKKMADAPSSIELNFGIKLAASSSKALSWIIDVGAETSMDVKVKWENNK